jgi:hypothetical protein
VIYRLALLFKHHEGEEDIPEQPRGRGSSLAAHDLVRYGLTSWQIDAESDGGE